MPGADIILAPVVKDVPVKYDVVRFNGSLLKENAFRQSAGPEVDAAWESLGVNCMRFASVGPFVYELTAVVGLTDRSVRVLPDIATQSGLLRDQVKINEKYGGGFPANVEGLHQLHCLVRHSSFAGVYCQSGAC